MARVSKLVTGDLSGIFGGTSSGYVSTFGIGSIENSLLPGVADIALYETGSGSTIVWQVTGNQVSALSGLTHIKINGTNYAVAVAPAFSSNTQVEFAYFNFVPGVNYSIELVGLTLFDGPFVVGMTNTVASAGAASVDFSSVLSGAARSAGDTLLIEVMTANQAITIPTGWSVITTPPTQGTAGAAGGVRTTVIRKDTVSDGTETTVSVGDSGDIQMAVGVVLRPGNGQSGLVEVDAVTSGNSAATTSGSFNSPTSTVANALVGYFITTDRDSSAASWGNLTNANLVSGSIVEQVDSGTTTNTGGGVCLIVGHKASAGAIGTATSTQAASAAYTYVTAAFKNPSAGGTPSAVPDNTAHTHAAGSPSLAAKSTVTPGDTAHIHAPSSPTIAAKSSVTPANADHLNAATSPTIGANSAVSPADAAHATAASQPTVSTATAISPMDCASSTAADQPSISAKSSLSPANCAHAHTATSPSVTTANTVTPDSAAHASVATSPSIGSAGSVSPDSAAHVTAADSPSLAAKSVVNVDSATHVQTAGAPSLVSGWSINPASASHDTATGTPSIAWRGMIAANDSVHEHFATSPFVVTSVDLPPVPPGRQVHTMMTSRHAIAIAGLSRRATTSKGRRAA